MTATIGLNNVPPNVMLVVDRSGSMGQGFDSGHVSPTNPSKWDSLNSAVMSLLDKNTNGANWGLTIFPQPGGDSSCTPGDPAVKIGSSVMSIEDALSNTGPNGNTPTGQTLQNLVNYQPLKDTTRPNYVVLLTDGRPNCTNPDNPSDESDPAAAKLGVDTITALYTATPSVKTFVVGLGTDTRANPDILNSWADAGHTALTGDTHYYQVNNSDDLAKAFANIVAGTASCHYALATRPPNPHLVIAYIGTTPVAIDPVNGTTYDAASNTLDFHGSSCALVKSDSHPVVNIVYGCPNPGIP